MSFLFLWVGLFAQPTSWLLGSSSGGVMELKPGVSLAGMRPELLLGIIVSQEVFRDYGFPLTITSVTDSHHSPGSLHYLGVAADFRTRDIPKTTLVALVGVLRSRLGPDFDIIPEPDHLHIEFQPKANR